MTFALTFIAFFNIGCVSQTQTTTTPHSHSDLFKTAFEPVGRIIQRGRLSTKYMIFDSGHEAMMLTKTADGYRLYVELMETGGRAPKSFSTYQLDENMQFRSLEYRRLGKPAPEVVFTRETQGITKATSETTEFMPMANGGVFLGPHDCAAFITIHQFKNLEVGQRTTFDALSYGNTGSKIARNPTRITREADEKIRIGGHKQVVRKYILVFPVDKPRFRTTYWTDDDGFVLRGLTKLPVGTLRMNWSSVPQ